MSDYPRDDYPAPGPPMTIEEYQERRMVGLENALRTLTGRLDDAWLRLARAEAIQAARQATLEADIVSMRRTVAELRETIDARAAQAWDSGGA